jgi:hypothetical protein
MLQLFTHQLYFGSIEAQSPYVAGFHMKHTSVPRFPDLMDIIPII